MIYKDANSKSKVSVTHPWLVNDNYYNYFDNIDFDIDEALAMSKGIDPYQLEISKIL